MEAKGISCRAAAQIVGINYNNAKVIARVYRREGRTRSVPKHLKRIKGLYNKNPSMKPVGKQTARLKELKDLLGPKAQDVKPAEPGSNESSRRHDV